MTNNRQRPVLFPYVGSKWRLVDRIVDLMPDHRHFVDLFGGSGSVMIGKPYSRIESFNDKDSDIYNLFRCLVDGHFCELRERVANTPSRSQRFFADAIEILARPNQSIPNVKAAWAFLLAAHQGLPVHPRLKKASDWLPNVTEWRGRWHDLPRTLSLVKARFADVQIFKDDWQKILHRLDRTTTCFYVDPPYPKDVLNSNRKLYVHEMPSLEQHRQLLDCLLAANGYVILSGYRNSLYDEVLAHWRSIKIRTSTNMGIGNTASPREEVLWLNYGPSGQRL